MLEHSPGVCEPKGRMLGVTHSHGAGHVASSVEDQVRDAVLILVAPVPERDLVGTMRQLGDALCPWP